MFDITKNNILITGAHGFLGKHIINELTKKGASRLSTPTVDEINLLSFSDCQKAVQNQDIVIHAAGKVGGISANSEQPGSFFYENALMGMQLMEAARLANVKKFVQIGSVCSYPKTLPTTPYKEEDLWNGYPEGTNAPYGLAKKMLLVQGQAYRQQYEMNVIHLLQVNLYGPNDYFNSPESHVIPALIHRFSIAKEQSLPQVECWGSGKPTREFLYVEDAARGIVLATEKYDSPKPVNLASGQEISIKDLATLIAQNVGYRGEIIWDASKPDGQPRRLFDSTRAEKEFGFTASTSFSNGLAATIKWYRANILVSAKEKIAL